MMTIIFTFVEFLSKIGPFLAGVGVLTGAWVGYRSYKFYNLKSLEEQWLSSFRDIYEFFWDDPRSSKTRILISSDSQYKKELEPILLKRLESNNNLLSDEDQNRVLDELDRFFSVMYRVKYLGMLKMTDEQRILYEKLYEDYWINKISERKELVNYIKIYWPGVLDRKK